MCEENKPIRVPVELLRERARELDCLYKIEGLLEDLHAPPDDVLQGIVQAIPLGWAHPEICRVRITLGSAVFQSPGFRETPGIQAVGVFMDNDRVGTIEVGQLQLTPPASAEPLPPERSRLLRTIAARLGHFLAHRHLLHPSEPLAVPVREQQSPTDDALVDETSPPPLQEPAADGLCPRCVHSPTCALPQREAQPVLSCAGFAERGRASAETASVGPSVAPEPEAGPSTGARKPPRQTGLCATCANRETCTFPEPEGGVWHCEEFA